MIKNIKKEIHKVVVGQDELIDCMLIAILSGGHILLEGVPGIAKTTAVNSMAKCFGLDFKRIQFTPDLLPSDITGNEILDLKENIFKIKHGPIFTHLLLADEINRAGAKIQSALLEAMAEKQVTIGEDTFKLDKPFMVLATSNPIDQEGTYSLPEASLDRFMLKVNVTYNTFDEEFEIVQRVGKKGFDTITSLMNKRELEELQEDVKNIHIDDELLNYILNIIFATREPENYGLEDIKQYIDFGVSPRGSIDLYNASKANAFLNGKEFVTPYDVAKVSYQVLRHRIILNYNATNDGITADDIIKTVLETIPSP